MRVGWASLWLLCSFQAAAANSPTVQMGESPGLAQDINSVDSVAISSSGSGERTALAVSSAAPAPAPVSSPRSSSSSSPAPKASPAPPPPARPTMQQYSELLSLLLQNMSPLAGPAPEQKNTIIRALQIARSSAHSVQGTMALYASDPIMRYLSLDLPKHFARIEQAYVNGNYAQARFLLRKTTQFCVACHAASSTKHSAILQFSEPLQHLSELERAEYFAATRRHEEAMLAYEKALTNKQFRLAQPELWGQAVENLLAITIRMRNDPHITLEMCSRLLEEGGHTERQRDILQTWRNSAKAWTTEQIGQKLGPQELIGRAKQLVERGNQLARRGASFGYIEYLRAMNLLNEVSISQAPDAVKAASYLIAGETSEKLRYVFFWMHPEAYYEACIRAKPRSVEAQTCFRNLQSYQTKQGAALFDQDVLRQLSVLSR